MRANPQSKNSKSSIGSQKRWIWVGTTVGVQTVPRGMGMAIACSQVRLLSTVGEGSGERLTFHDIDKSIHDVR